MTANELMGNAWIVQCSRALDIRLYESDFSNDSKWLDMMDILNEYINGICAINNDLLIKPMEEISNTLLTRRCEKENDDENQTKKHKIQRLTPSSLDELGSSPLLQPA
ncbi:unnamed protein product [Anisakis simplex]|uniref:Uncharacterized protein n=1 Tax=Anisakis simplex TaxID=6269 RepID=A0A0M3JCA6_ANISI|nr:unnamed protein product [Anisakis simplex]